MYVHYVITRRLRATDHVQLTEIATMAELDSYLECLYDDMQAKIRGTGLILQLARIPDNLAFLIESGMYLGVIYSPDGVRFLIAIHSQFITTNSSQSFKLPHPDSNCIFLTMT